MSLRVLPVLVSHDACFCSEFRFDVPSKVCFVDFEEAESVGVALHLTNTIFIDRALIVARSRYRKSIIVL